MGMQLDQATAQHGQWDAGGMQDSVCMGRSLVVSRLKEK